MVGAANLLETASQHGIANTLVCAQTAELLGDFPYAATHSQISALCLGPCLFGKTIHVAGSLSGNYWNGNRTVQFRIVDAARA